MKRIYAIAAIGLLALALASCSHVKKASSFESSKSDSSATSLVKSEQETTIKKKVDTTVQVKGDSLKGSVQLPVTVQVDPDRMLRQEDTAVQTHEIESGTMKITTTFDPKTGKLDVAAYSKPKEVTVQIDEETTLRNSQEAAQSVSTSSEEVKATQVKESQPAGFWSVFWWLLRTFWWLLLLVIAWLIWRHRPTLLNFLNRVRRR